MSADPFIPALLLVGYEKVFEDGFALPCYGRAPQANAYYRAVTKIPGDRDSPVSHFEPYVPSLLTPLDGEFHRQVSVGDAWCDVLLVDGEVVVGSRSEVWAALSSRLDALVTTSPLMLLDVCPEAEVAHRDGLARSAFTSIENQFGEARALAWRDQVYLRSGALLLARRHIEADLRGSGMNMSVGSDASIRIELESLEPSAQAIARLVATVEALARPFFDCPSVSVAFVAPSPTDSIQPDGPRRGPAWRRSIIERTVDLISRKVPSSALILPTVAGPTSIIREICTAVDQLRLFDDLVVFGGKSATGRRILEALSEPGLFQSLVVSAQPFSQASFDTAWSTRRRSYKLQSDPAKTLAILVDGDLALNYSFPIIESCQNATMLAVLPPNLNFMINGQVNHEPESVSDFLSAFTPIEQVVFDYEMAISSKLITGTVVIDRSSVLEDATKVIVAARARDRRNVLACIKDLLGELDQLGQSAESCLVLTDIDARDFSQILPSIRSIPGHERVFYKPEGTYPVGMQLEEGGVVVAKPDQFDHGYVRWAKNVALVTRNVDIGLRIHWYDSKVRKSQDNSPRRIFDYTGALARTHPVSARLPRIEDFADILLRKGELGTSRLVNETWPRGSSLFVNTPRRAGVWPSYADSAPGA